MPSTFSDSLRIELQATGENENDWGDKTNNNLGLIEDAIAGVAPITVSSVDVTLTTNDAADDQARHQVLRITGSVSTSVNVIFPDKEKTYWVQGAFTGSHVVRLKNTSGTGIEITAGEDALIFTNGTETYNLGLAVGDGSITTAKIATSAVTADKLEDTAISGAARSFTKQQYFGLKTLTDATTITWDVADNQVATVTLGGNRTLAAPTNPVAGGVYTLIVKQDATGGRTLTLDSSYITPDGSTITFSTGANAVDVITCVYDGTSMITVPSLNFS